MVLDVLFKIWQTAESDYSSDDEKQKQLDAFNSIAWFVETGRSCLAWERSLSKANPKKLLRYIIKQDDQSVRGQVESATAYLRRYCRYS